MAMGVGCSSQFNRETLVKALTRSNISFIITPDSNSSWQASHTQTANVALPTIYIVATSATRGVMSDFSRLATIRSTGGGMSPGTVTFVEGIAQVAGATITGAGTVRIEVVDNLRTDRSFATSRSLPFIVQEG